MVLCVQCYVALVCLPDPSLTSTLLTTLISTEPLTSTTTKMENPSQAVIQSGKAAGTAYSLQVTGPSSPVLQLVVTYLLDVPCMSLQM